MEKEHVRLLILGGGPAGYTAAIYGARANLNPVLYEGLQPGGQLTTTTEVENYPGFPKGLAGFDLMNAMKEQATRLGADIRSGEATAVDFTQDTRLVTINGEHTLTADALIIATGASARYLGLPSEEKFKGMGVSACATCDGFFFRGKRTAVVGGGDSACEEATFLASICTQVYMVVRKPAMRASKAMLERVESTPNLKVLYQHEPTEVLGNEQGVTGLRMHNNATNESVDIEIDGLFLAIGHTPNTKFLQGHLALDKAGYIVTKPGTPLTSVEGVFAAGDVQDSRYRQAITAAASGCQAALDAERFLGTRIF